MLKQSFDVVLSLLGLLILAPFFLLIGLAIKLDSRGSIFYRGNRIGRDGIPFKLFKFRTMIQNADQQGAGITASGDTRVTNIGRLLRRTKLDELPQLLNVLRGEMSLVGPRPEDPRYVDLYTPEQRLILSVRPGITSLASLEYRHEEQFLTGADWEQVYRDEIMPAKIAIDLAYIDNYSLRQDIIILLRTVAAIFS